MHEPPPFPALAATGAAPAWAHRSSTAFPGAEAPDLATVVVLPVHGLADHALGLPLDVEEVVGSALLQSAVSSTAASVCILPPLRLGLSPYGLPLGALDVETAHEVVQEMLAGVCAAGFRRVLFWITNPWHVEWIDAAARDARIGQGMQTFVIGAAGLGLDLHPASSADRERFIAVAAHLLGHLPEVPAAGATRDHDARFRPGHWADPTPTLPDPQLDGREVFNTAAHRFSALLDEVAARPPLQRGQSAGPRVTAAGPRATSTPAAPHPFGYRHRYLPALTARALRALPEKHRALVILPVAAVEQHGPHLPVGVDAMLAEAAAAGLSRHLRPEEPVWFLPTLLVGKSNEHHDYPGTLSLSARTLRRVILAWAHQVHALGFRQLALLNTHGGNSSVLVYTLRELQTAPGLRAGMLRLRGADELSPQEATWGFHAGEWETSLMLALAPDLVAMDRACCHYPARLTDAGQLRPENAPAIFSWQTRDIAPDGVMGDATAATVEKGRRWLGTALEDLTARVRALLASPGPPTRRPD